MNKLVTIMLLLLSGSAYTQIKGDSWESVRSSGKGIVSIVYYEQPGLIQKVDGQMKGVCVDILQEFKKFVKEKYGKDIEINYARQEKEFANFLKVVQSSNNVLGVTNTSITEERKKIFKFTPTYMSTPLVFLTNESAPSIKNLSDLPRLYKGFTAEVITGSTHVKHIDRIKREFYPELEVKLVGSSESVIKDISSNPKVFSILDFTEYVGVVRKKLPVKRQEIEIGNPEELGFIMSKQSDWDGLWREFLTPEFRKSITYKKIISDNLGQTFLNLVR